ncbi:MAG: antirestriction protein ArdA [Tepidisphaeraceae bacterium]
MSISNSDDVIDSRDIIARIEELEAERQTLADGVSEAEEAYDNTTGDSRGAGIGKLFAARQALQAWDDSDEAEELKTLKALAEEAEGYAADWRYGETLIRDSYFRDYAEELANDIGAINSDASWPNNCIDWDRAARELQMDYTAVDFGGVTYWIR